MSAPHTLLIVEDDPGLISYLKRLLRRIDVKLITANRGKKAIQCLNTGKVDLVLLDIDLPDIDGYQVMDHILKELPETLFIVMTGEVSVESAVKALRKGAYDYLRKPFESTEMVKTVENALDRLKLERQHKQTEEALRKSEQQFKDLIENTPIGISIFQDNQFVYQNPEQIRINGPSSEKSIFEDLERIHPDDLNKFKTAYRRIIKGEVLKTEVDFRFFRSAKKDTKTDICWVWCRAIAFKYHGKDAILVNSIDITKAKQLEHQLLITNKMLSLGRVAAGIAHEIRNPLTGINTYLYTIEDLCDSDQIGPEDMDTIRQIITQIQIASNKIESVIRRVMDFSKPGAPKMVRTNINEPLDAAIKLSKVTMRKNGTQIEKSLTPNLPHCYADPHLIEQVVLNLITNAVKAMEKSNGNKLVEIKSFAKNNVLCIQIADSGPGVPIELREKIFDPFFTTKADGSGIGLNIAQRIVADHNGSITLDSSKWGGAQFKIELPIERRTNA
jgi:PAS domain S-box-containing protein